MKRLITKEKILMADNYKNQNDKSNFHPSLEPFKKITDMRLCTEFYELSKEDDSYTAIMEKLHSLSSCSLEELQESLPNLLNEFPALFNLIKYIRVCQCSHKDLFSSDDSFITSCHQTICVTTYGKYASEILDTLEDDFPSYDTYEQMQSPLYLLQKKNLLFDKEFIEKCLHILESRKKNSPFSANPYPSQINFKRLIKRFHLTSIEKILFQECTEERKSYLLPVCSLPSLTFLFLIYHNTFLPLNQQFSVLSDAFIHIAVSKNVSLPSILNILHTLKKGFEHHKLFMPQNDRDILPKFFQNPGKPPTSGNLISSDKHYICTRAFEEYEKLKKAYSSKINLMETYREIEACILTACTKLFKEPKKLISLNQTPDLAEKSNLSLNMQIELKGEDLIKYLDIDPAYPVSELPFFKEDIEYFLTKFQYAERGYKPIPSEELFDILKTLTIADHQTRRRLKCITYSSPTYSYGLTKNQNLFSLSPLCDFFNNSQY